MTVENFVVPLLSVAADRNPHPSFDHLALMFLPLAARSFDTIDLFFGEAVVVAEIVRWRAVTVVAWHIGTRQLHGRSSRTAIGPGGGGRDAMYVFGAIVEHCNNTSKAVSHDLSVRILVLAGSTTQLVGNAISSRSFGIETSSST